MSLRPFILGSALCLFVIASQGAAQSEGAGSAARTVSAAQAAGLTAFQVGQMVEVNDDGVWYKASIVGVRNGRYSLSRHDRSYGVTTDEEWVGADRLRPYVAKPVALPAVAGLPRSVPEGLYTCVTYGSVNATLGKLRIVSSNSSSAITRDGSGPQQRFASDASTGAITWVGGMKVSGWAIESALYRPTTADKPNINLHYRLREGGNLNSMYCKRE